MAKARLVLEAPTIVSQIPICFGGNSKYCCHGWGRIPSGFGEVVQSLNRGSPALIRKDGVTVKTRARGFLWMGTQPSQSASPAHSALGQAPHLGLGTRGCCSCHRRSLATCCTSTADSYTFHPGRGTLRAYRGLQAQGGHV